MIHPQDNMAGMPVERVNLETQTHYPKVWVLPTWAEGDDHSRMNVLRYISKQSGADPRFATLAVQIIKEAQVEPRDYKGQAQALLKWVQHNIYYINEPAERLQDPAYTLTVGYADCDDMCLVLAALYESIGLDWRFVLSGTRPKRKKMLFGGYKNSGKEHVRWIEGSKIPKNAPVWSHVYLMVGYPPAAPERWYFAEPTLRGVDLGWDIVNAMKDTKDGGVILPEMSGLGDVPARKLKNAPPPKFKPEPEEKPERNTKVAISKLKERLHPANLITDVLIGAVTAVLIGKAIDIIERRFFKPKRKKRR